MQRIVIILLAAAMAATGFAKNPVRSGTTAPTAERSAPYLYTEGIKQLTINGDSAAALRLTDEALRADSLYAPAQHLAARLNMEQRSKEALSLARRAWQSNPDNKFYLETLGEAAVRAGEYDEATEYYATLTRTGRNPDNFRILALLHEKNNRMEEAIATLDSAEVRIGRVPQLLNFRQRLLLASQQLERAEAEAEQMVADMPYRPESHIAKAEVMMALGRDSTAEACLTEALKIDEANVMTLLVVAEYYFRKNDIDRYLHYVGLIFDSRDIMVEDKIAHFKSLTSNRRFYEEHFAQINIIARKLILNHPTDREVMKLYASHLIACNKTELALGIFKDLLDGQATEEDYMTVVGIEGYLQRLDSVKIYTDQALQRFGDRVEFLVIQGELASMQNDNNEAIASFRKALNVAQTDEQRSDMWRYIGDAEQNGNRKKRCYEAYEKALKYNPDNHVALNNYAYSLSNDICRLDSALAMATRAISLLQNSPEYLDTLGWVLYRLGRYDEAKRYLQQALSFDNNSQASLALHYGDILDALGEHFMAKTYWRKALERGYDANEIELRLSGAQPRPTKSSGEEGGENAGKTKKRDKR